MRSFPYGAAALIILVLAVGSGAYLARYPVRPRPATLTFWIFARSHFDAYKQAIPAYERAHPGVTIGPQLVSNRALAARLQAALLAGVDVPDLVEVEISQAGSLFRGPLQDVGFLDLTDRVRHSGLWERMVQARFAPYSSRGRIFGLPHDVHPVMLAYRRDLFEEAGVEIARAETWEEFLRLGRPMARNGRYLIELSDTNTNQLDPLLFQRGGGLFDAEGRCVFDNEVGVRTLLWYVPLVAGPDRVANNLGEGQILTRAVEDGYLLSLVTPDWRSKSYERDIPRMRGKMALMPLPAPHPGGRRTSTQGGTMLGITKRCPNPDLAWDFALHLYLDKGDLAGRFRDTNILPSARDAWDHPAYREPRAYWSGQPLGALYAQLAPHVPFQYTSPLVVTGKNKLGEALVACVQRYNARGASDFEPFVRARLKQSADELRRLIARNPYR